MAFEGLRDQLKEQWADLSAKIQESQTFNNAREKFEAQTPEVQRAIMAGSAFVLVFVLLWIPYTYYATSQDYMSLFDENRDLIIGLQRAARSAKSPSPLPPPVDAQNLRTQMENVFRNARLLPDQIGTPADMPPESLPSSRLAPPAVIKTGVAIQLKSLNVRQIVDVTTQMANLGPGTKVMGMDIVQSLNQTHYYDLILKVVNFGLPEIASAGPADSKDSGNRGRSRPGRTTDEDVE